ncbi:MAG: hypothetical protein ISS52_07040 [Dehalococcoidia bacterium]|nr:hypothetical protein [Dehalococcoidia bacterium]
MRKVLGYLRYDTLAELSSINDLHRGDLRRYKNFFQPVMKPVSKEKIGGRVKRKYDIPKTPYQRLMESAQLPQQATEELKGVYGSSNLAQLKRSIDAKLDNLYRTYQREMKAQQSDPHKRLTLGSVASSVMQ